MMNFVRDEPEGDLVHRYRRVANAWPYRFFSTQPQRNLRPDLDSSRKSDPDKILEYLFGVSHGRYKPGNNQTVDKRAGQTETLFRDSGSVLGGYLGIMYFQNLESSLLEGPMTYFL